MPMFSRGLVSLSVVVASAAPAAAQPYGHGYGYGMMGAWGSGYWPHGMFVWLVVLVAIVLVVVWAVRAMSAPHRHAPPPGPRRSTGLDVLEERYARGEIGRDEYLQKKVDIGG